MKETTRSAIIKLIILLASLGVAFATFKFISRSVINVYESSDLYVEKSEIQDLQYSFDGVTYKNISLFSKENKYEKKQNMILKGTIETRGLKEAELFIQTDNNYYDIYVDGHRFLKRDRTNNGNNFVFLDFKALPEDSDGKNIKIYLFANNPSDIGNVSKLYVANKFQVTYSIISLGFASCLFSIITLVFGILLLLSGFSKRYVKYGLNIVGYFSILVGALWIFAYNPLATLYIDNTYLISFIKHIIIYQFPIAILLFTEKYEQSNTNKRAYKTTITFYLMFLLGVLIIELLGIISIQEFQTYANICIVVIILMSFRVFIKLLKINYKITKVKIKMKLGKEVPEQQVNIIKNAHRDVYDYSVFDKIIPLVFCIFLCINLIGLTAYIILDEESIYVYSLAISTIILLIVCAITLSYDLEKVNYSFVLDQETKIINNKRFNILVDEQANLFKEVSIANICDKFSNNIKGILFPYGYVANNDRKNILGDEVRRTYRNDYKMFVEKSSSLIYIITPDEEDFRTSFSYEISAGTGRFEKYVGTDPYVSMDREEFGRILFIMKGVVEPYASEIAVIIGSESEPNGLILFSDLGNIDPLLKGLLESYVRTCAILIENLMLIDNARNIQHDTVYNLNEISELRSKETGHHIRRVSLYSALIGKKMGLNDEQIEELQLASSMHDIGKINIPDSILNKPAKLTDEEFEIMKTHAEIGYELLKNTNNKVMQLASVIARYHHEKYNGRGYYGLKGESIPLIARIVAVSDVFDALSVIRVYKDAWPLEKIMNLFEEERDQHFDSAIVNILVDNLDEFIEIRDKYKEKE